MDDDTAWCEEEDSESGTNVEKFVQFVVGCGRNLMTF